MDSKDNEKKVKYENSLQREVSLMTLKMFKNPE